MVFLRLLQKYRTLLILVILMAVASFLSKDFFTLSNLFNVARQVSITALVASGMTAVILLAEIDLSVGSVLAVSGAVGAGILQAHHGLAAAVLGALLIGAAFGLVNGLLVTKGGMPSFIVTLATMAVGRGLTLSYTQGNPIPVTSQGFQFFGGGYLGPIPFPIVLMFVVYVLFYVMLTYTRFGRYIYAVGGNAASSKLSGINTDRVKIIVFVLSGVLAALTAIVLTARLSSAEPTAGSGLELDAIAAVILGGTSLMGGQGGVLGTIIGAFIMGILGNSLNLLNVSPFYQDVAKGIIIILAVLMDTKFAALSLHPMWRGRAGSLKRGGD